MIIYLGQYVSEKVYTCRGLPTLNAAGTNRMQRIAEALQDAGEDCWILSSGSAARMGWRGRWLHRARVERRRGVPLLFAATVGIPFLSVCWSQVAVLIALFQLKRRREITGIIVYNFHLLDFVVACIGRFGFKVPVLLDLEDVSIPKWGDFRRNSGTSAFQQLRLWPLMKATILTCHAVFAPTRRFREVVPLAKPFEVISGCMRIPKMGVEQQLGSVPTVSESHPLEVLFSGQIESEFGIDIVAEAIRILDSTPGGTHFVFHFCGNGSGLSWLRDAVQTVRRVRVQIHGFVSNQSFSQILRAADVCVVLQNPKGRHAQHKTPSKGYEAMCFGKALIISEIGDFGEMPSDVCIKVVPYTAEQLAKQLSDLTREKVNQYALSALSYARMNWDAPLCGKKIIALMRPHVQPARRTATERGCLWLRSHGMACPSMRQG